MWPVCKYGPQTTVIAVPMTGMSQARYTMRQAIRHTDLRKRSRGIVRAQRDRGQPAEKFQFDQATAKKGFKYVKVVTKYAFGIDIDAYIPLIFAAGSLLALITFGLSGLFIVAASALGVFLASSLVFFSLGWLFVPLVSFMVIGALAAGVGSFLLFPAVALGSVFALVSTLSSVAFSRLDDRMIDDVIDSLDEDDRFEREELERFDERLRMRSGSRTRRIVSRSAYCRALHTRQEPRNVLDNRAATTANTTRQRRATRGSLVAWAGRPPNFNNGSFDFDSLDIDEESVRLVEETLPVLGILLGFGFLYPLFGIPLPVALVVGVGATVGVAFTSGYLSRIDGKFGISTTQSVVAIIGLVFAIFAVPAVLRFAFFLLALGAAANLVSMLVNPNGGGIGGMGSGGINSGMEGMGGFGDVSEPYVPPGARTKSSSSSNSNARNQSTIDVEWESIDD